MGIKLNAQVMIKNLHHDLDIQSMHMRSPFRPREREASESGGCQWSWSIRIGPACIEGRTTHGPGRTQRSPSGREHVRFDGSDTPPWRPWPLGTADAARWVSRQRHCLTQPRPTTRVSMPTCPCGRPTAEAAGRRHCAGRSGTKRAFVFVDVTSENCVRHHESATRERICQSVEHGPQLSRRTSCFESCRLFACALHSILPQPIGGKAHRHTPGCSLHLPASLLTSVCPRCA